MWKFISQHRKVFRTEERDGEERERESESDEVMTAYHCYNVRTNLSVSQMLHIKQNSQLVKCMMCP